MAEIEDLRRNDEVQDHRLEDIQHCIRRIETRLEKIEGRLWAFMATVAGAVVIDLLLKFRP